MPNCGNALPGNEHRPTFECRSFIFLLVVSDILVKANCLRIGVGEVS